MQHVGTVILLQSLISVYYPSYEVLLTLAGAGEVWTWGNNFSGQLGHGDTGTGFTPKRVDGMKMSRSVRVGAGSEHTAVVTSTGEVWVWGNGAQGRLGLGDTTPRHTPAKVEGLPDI